MSESEKMFRIAISPLEAAFLYYMLSALRADNDIIVIQLSGFELEITDSLLNSLDHICEKEFLEKCFELEVGQNDVST